MNGYRALHEAAGLFDHDAVGAVAVEGADARSFLQSLVSQDIERLVEGEGAHSLLLQPTGKLDVEFRVLVVGDGDDRVYWLDTEPGWGTRLADSLRRFLLRVDAQVTDRGEGWGRVSVRGPHALTVVGQVSGVEIPAAAHAHVPWGEVRIVRADWPGLRGVDLVGPLSAVGGAVPMLVDHGAVPARAGEWETVRIESGVARLGVDLDDNVIPQEAFLDRVAVSFDKGCFLGQELVCRIQDRGHVNRHLRRLRMDSPAPSSPPPAGAEILHDGAPVGSVTSAAVSPVLDAAVALGYVRREVELGSRVDLRWDGGGGGAVVEEVLLAG